MQAFAICRDRQCGFSQGYDDIREAPDSCPKCGKPLAVNCSQCGALFRNGSGRCVNCGTDARAVAGRDEIVPQQPKP